MANKIIFEDTTRPSERDLRSMKQNCGDSCDDCGECFITDTFETSAPASGSGHISKGVIRYAYKADIPALRDIYNYEVLNGVATFDENARTLADRTEWFEEHQVPHHPLMVAVLDGIVIGYASLSSYRPKEAYKSTVELSVYIHEMYRGRGVATALMRAILNYAKRDDTLHNVISVITSGNEASVILHNRFGFTFNGTTPEVALKFGRYLGTDTYYLLV